MLLRNLRDLFGEIDPIRGRAAIDEIFHETPCSMIPMAASFVAVPRSTTSLGDQGQSSGLPLAEPEVVGDVGRIRWVSGSRGQPPTYAGTDFAIARGGKVAAVYLFFDALP